jgi:hypothetical protein
MRSTLGPYELSKEELAVPTLARHLRQGSLALFLGAGVSCSVGLPSWKALVIALAKAMSLNADHLDEGRITASELLDLVESVKQACRKEGVALNAQILQLLYERTNFAEIAPDSDLLRAICSLICGGGRGSVSRVLTLNFDNVLELRLNHDGVQYTTVCEFPGLVTSSPQIVHLQGCLPSPGTRDVGSSQDVIFSTSAAHAKLGDREDWAQQILRRTLEERFILFIGTSELTLKDAVVGSVLTDAAKSLKKSGPTGIWLFGEEISPEDTTLFRDTNVAPLVLSGFHDVPRFLLAICRHAAG